MNRFTYQDKPQLGTLEKYEWDRMWIEDTEDSDALRVLYIGDSISCKTFPFATKAAEREIIFNSFATSKALDNPSFYPSVVSFIEQCPRYDAIIFNNGLHGWHLAEEEYGRLYLEFMTKLRGDYPDTPICVVLTTATAASVPNSERSAPRNEQAQSVAKALGLPVIDLYTPSVENASYLEPDGVHFTVPGYTALAQALVEQLRDILDASATCKRAPQYAVLEKYEWDRMWIEDTEDVTAKRVLYLGASTSASIFPHATAASERSILFSNFASSKALDNPYYYPSLKSFIGQCARFDAIVLQNGLHGWHLAEEEYGKLYGELMMRLKADYPDTPIFVALTTAVSDKTENVSRVVPRNEQTRLAARAAGVEVIDLYRIALENINLLSADGLHFTAEGYKKLGNSLYDYLNERI